MADISQEAACDGPEPQVTLLVPVHRGRESFVCDLLRSIASARPSRWAPREIVLCTRDLPDLLATVRTALPSLPIPCRLAYSPDAPTLARQRNDGLRAVQTPWVLGADSDILFPEDYFTRLESAIDAGSPRADGYQMRFVAAPGASLFARYEAALDQMVLASYMREEGVFGMAGANFLARVDALLRHGGFREEMVAASDVELGYRLNRAGVRIVYLPSITVLHRYPNRLSELLRRKVWHGRGYAFQKRYFPDLFRQLPPERGSVWRMLRSFANPLFASYVLVAQTFFWWGLLREQRRLRKEGKPSPRFAR